MSSKDPFFNLKYVGFCLAQMPPKAEDVELADFVNYAKFQLSMEKRVLLEDPIWDAYSDEQLLAEYYAVLFTKDKEAREEFERELGIKDTSIDDFANWADAEIEKNREALEILADEQEDSVHFNPETLGE